MSNDNLDIPPEVLKKIIGKLVTALMEKEGISEEEATKKFLEKKVEVPDWMRTIIQK